MRFDLSSDLASRIPEVFGRAHGVKGSETTAMGLTSYYTKVYELEDERPYGADLHVQYKLESYRYIPDKVVYMLFDGLTWLTSDVSRYRTCILNHKFTKAAYATFCGVPVYMELFDMGYCCKLYLFSAPDGADGTDWADAPPCIGTILLTSSPEEGQFSAINLDYISELLTRKRHTSARKLQRSWLAAKLNPKYNLCHTLLLTDLRSYRRF